MRPAEAATSFQIPDVGGRGGLGRTLLTAFLVLAILPLSAISWYATTRSRQNIQQEVLGRLSSIAALKETQILDWAEAQQAQVAALADGAEISAAIFEADHGNREAATNHLAVAIGASSLLTIALVAQDGAVVAASDPALIGQGLSPPQPGAPPRMALTEGGTVTLFYPLPAQGDGEPYILAAWPATDTLREILAEKVGLGETGEIYLTTVSTAIPSDHASSVALAAAASPPDGLYENASGVPVIGVHRRLPALNATLVVEQAQEEAFAGNDAVVTAVIVATLAVALGAAISAALVARRITHPIVRLTGSVVRIASGDLSQRVQITSRDEIGILAYVFNHMAAELEALYNDLEEKVAQRTQLLQQANYQIQRRAIQMQATIEVGQAMTSILEPDSLLKQVVRLIQDRFVYSQVAIYTSDGPGQPLALRAAAGDANTSYASDQPVPRLVQRAYNEGAPATESHLQPITVGPPARYVRFEVALPLRVGERTIGVLDVQSTEPEGFDADDLSALQSVAYQLAIALENARAYAVEREAAERLRQTEQFKRNFLANMSHELRTPLTNILGFSRLMLKESNGPLPPRQREDLQIIYHNGEHLLGLINDLLDISQIEAGLMELNAKEIQVGELIHSVMATASALVRGKDITLREEVPAGLPTVQADPARIRQVLLRLLANAAKFTEQGTITVRARANNGQIEISVSDSGVGVPPEDRERIFREFEQGTLEGGRRPNGAGLGLALSKEFVEMHGGRMWVESEIGKGSTFGFTLPVRPTPQQATLANG